LKIIFLLILSIIAAILLIKRGPFPSQKTVIQKNYRHSQIYTIPPLRREHINCKEFSLIFAKAFGFKPEEKKITSKTKANSPVEKPADIIGTLEIDNTKYLIEKKDRIFIRRETNTTSK
jgi:hypothetical protein